MFPVLWVLFKLCRGQLLHHAVVRFHSGRERLSLR